MLAAINFLSIFIIVLFIGSKKIYKNIINSFIFSLFITLEGFSYLYFTNKIDENFIFFIFNINIYKLGLSTKLLILYYGILFFLVLWTALYYILKKIHLKFKKVYILIPIAFLLSPYGFFYTILKIFILDYGFSYYYYKNSSYKDLYRKIKNDEYTPNNELKIKNIDENHKNLVLIYLESYEQSYLTNKEISKYTKNIQNISKSGKFYKDIEQIPGSIGTLAGIITSQCGVQYLAYFIIDNPYNKINKNTNLVCLPDILHKAGYNQIFIGGANKSLFNKGNYLESHYYDIVEDEKSLLEKSPHLKNNLYEWGVADYDLFNIAKKEYLNFSSKNKPFNLTILTTSTHNPNGVFDKRCQNSSKINLINGIECTDYLLNDFINFLKKQKNYKNTLVVILPDHRQYDYNNLSKIINKKEQKLFLIILNSSEKYKIEKMNYTNIPEIILNDLNIKSNAKFLNKQEDHEIIRNFMHKTHK